MNTGGRAEPEALLAHLRRVAHHGARASRLARFAADFVDLVVPIAPSERPDARLIQRAILAEGLIRQAAHRLGGDHERALSVILGLEPGTVGMNLERRRQIAAAIVGVLPDTFRRDRHEGLMLWDLACELYQVAEAHPIDEG